MLFLIAVPSTLTLRSKTLNPNKGKEWLVGIDLNPPVESRFSIYFFNLTNPDQFLNGAKPILNEVGPYVYRETWSRSDVDWVTDDTLEYTSKKAYKFNLQESQGNRLRDQITTINVPFITAVDQAKNGPPSTRQSLGSFLALLNERPVVTKTVQDLLWGYETDLLEIGRKSAPPGTKTYNHEVFGFFVGKNFTDNGKLTIATGLGTNGHLGKILKVDGKNNLGLWARGSKCDAVRGSDGLFFDNKLKKSDEVLVYEKNLCRTIPFTYERDIVAKNGLRGQRFVQKANTYETAGRNPENACYCTQPRQCSTTSGLFGIGICQFDSPTFISQPHFTNADPKLLNDVVGLRPDPAKYQSYFDIQKGTGLTLSGSVSAQMNMKVVGGSGITGTEGLRDIVLPVLWFMVDSDGINDERILQRLKILGPRLENE